MFQNRRVSLAKPPNMAFPAAIYSLDRNQPRSPEMASTEPIATRIAPNIAVMSKAWLRSSNWARYSGYNIQTSSTLNIAVRPMQMSFRVPKGWPTVKNKMMMANANKPTQPVGRATQPTVTDEKLFIVIVPLTLNSDTARLL